MARESGPAPLSSNRSPRAPSGSVVVKPVPAGATVVGVPGRVVESFGSEREELDFEHGNLPDPLSDLMKMILQLHTRLEERVKQLEHAAEKTRSS
jgi:serine O-acetyltransferase